MKRCGWVVLGVLALSLACTNTAVAGGWGAFFSWSRQDASSGIPDVATIERFFDVDIPDEYQPLLNEIGYDVQLDHLTFGVQYDSAPSRDKLFNYRMSLGFDIATNLDLSLNVPKEIADIPGIGVDVIDVSIDDSSSYGFGMRHTFGFGIIRTDLLKWWVGPALNLNLNYWSDPGKALALSIGGGAETGVNLHVSPRFSICLGGGILYDAFGEATSTGDDDLTSLSWGSGPFYFIQVAALFHTGDDQTAWEQAAVAPMQ